MFAQRLISQAAPRLSAQLRNTAFRGNVQRRLASTENAFVKEREAVKEHAAATTGAYTSPRQLFGPFPHSPPIATAYANIMCAIQSSGARSPSSKP